MAVPEPRSLLLRDAADRVADRCGVSVEEAKAALDRAFREHSLAAYDSCFAPITDWEFLTIDWDKNSIRRDGSSVTYAVESVSVFKEHLDDWMASAVIDPHPRSASRYKDRDLSTVGREWPPLLDGIEHVQRVRASTLGAAARELQTRLYEGHVKSRVAGRRYQIPRHDGIEPSDWYHATIFEDGGVEFGRDPALLKLPTGLGVPRYQVEVCWADVLRYWPEPVVASAGAQRLIPAVPLAASAQGIQESRAGSGDGVSSLPLPKFVACYIQREREAGRTPSKRQLEVAWHAAGRKGRRGQRNTEFERQMGEDAPQRGRPRIAKLNHQN